MHHHVTIAAGALAAVAAAACASRPAPSSASEPVPTPVAGATPPLPAGVVAAFTWAPAERRLEVRTEVDVVRDDGAAPATPAGEPPERVRTVVRLADTLSTGTSPGAVRATGVVESLEVAASARVQGTAGAPPFAPFAYQALSDARGVRADPAPGAAVDLRCTAPGGPASLGALAIVRETLPRVPAGATVGARWRDTTVSATCAGPVLLVVQTTSRYEAQAGEGGALAVVRRSTSTMQGRGAAGIRPVTVAGSGTGETRYLLDGARGTLLAATGETRTSLTVTVAGAAQRFVQRARTEIAAR